MADRLDDRQLDDPPRQQAQRPVRVALRGRPQTQGDDVSLLFAVEQFRDRGELPPFSFQRLLEPSQHASLANVLDGLGAARKGVGDPLVGPRRPVRIGLQENLSAAHFLAAPVELAERLSTDLAFLGCESNDVPFFAAWKLSRLETSSPIVLTFIDGTALATTLWFWNTEIGWATVHLLLAREGWEYVQTILWNKGIGHVAGNVNGDTIRRLPTVTEVCAFYRRDLKFPTADGPMPAREWLRSGMAAGRNAPAEPGISRRHAPARAGRTGTTRRSRRPADAARTEPLGAASGNTARCGSCTVSRGPLNE